MLPNMPGAIAAAGSHFRSALRTLGSLLPEAVRRRVRGARLTRPWRDDAAHSYPSVGLTPSRVLSLLHAADAGSPQLQFELFDEMLQKWPRLASVEATRRLALTGLDWEVLPAGTGDTQARSRVAAEQVAAYCSESLGRIERLRDALDHLASAIGYGISVAELVWERGELTDIVPVPHSRLIGDPHEPWRLRVRTEEDPTSGIALDEQPNKWVIHMPRPKPGRHFEGGLLRSSVLLYVAQNLSFKDWLIFSQIAGMPVRVAQFEPGTTEEDRRALLKMLSSLGTDAVAVLSKNVDLRLIEPAGSGAKPYQPLQEYCNTEITILWLGQHLTTELKSSGSRAAAEIHDRVREDLLVDDIADEGQTLRRDVLRPLVQARFGPEVATPIFRRSLIESVDTRVLADTLSVAVRELGLRVPQRWVHRALGIPEAGAGEAVLTREVHP